MISPAFLLLGRTRTASRKGWKHDCRPRPLGRTACKSVSAVPALCVSLGKPRSGVKGPICHPPDQIIDLATTRGPDFTQVVNRFDAGKQPTTQKTAPTKVWAAFLLSGAGR